MKLFAALIAAASLIATGGAAVARSPNGETTLARMLEGRVAGKPMRCITAFRSNDIEVIDRVGVIYRDGKTIWVARADDPDSVRDYNVMIFERFSGSQLCREDISRTVDRDSGFLTSVVFVGDFVPYSREG
ncbi:MAG: hypothetical protein ABIT09_00350 [Croceibacterium sp.]